MSPGIRACKGSARPRRAARVSGAGARRAQNSAFAGVEIAAGDLMSPRKTWYVSAPAPPKGRSRAKARGQQIGRPLALTPEQRKEATRRRARGATLQKLARSYAVVYPPSGAPRASAKTALKPNQIIPQPM